MNCWRLSSGIKWILSSLLALGLAAAFSLAATPPVGLAAPPPQSGTGGATALFQQRCGPCHSADGQGTQNGPALTHLDQHSDDELFQIISEGKSGTMMPAWKTMLGADEIRGLIPYVRSLGMAAMVQPPSSSIAPSAQPAPRPQPKPVVALDLEPSTAGVVILRASVQDDQGHPLFDVPVNFILVTSLGGKLPVGSVRTDSLGHAVIEYTAGVGRTVSLQASVGEDADAVIASGTTTTSGAVEWSPEPLIAPNPPGPEIVLLLIVFGGVWTTYVFIGRQLVGISQEG